MGWIDTLRADWLASRDADEYFERLQEAREGYGPDAPAADGEPAAEPADTVTCAVCGATLDAGQQTLHAAFCEGPQAPAADDDDIPF